MNDLSYNEFTKEYFNYNNFFHVSSINDLEQLLVKLNPEKSNFVSYIWHEYGYISGILNWTYSEFFDRNQNNGKIIGTCFPGMEIFYRDKVDILIVLDNFINTTNLIQKWQRTHRPYTEQKTFSDKEFESMLQRLNFKNTIWPAYNEEFKFRELGSKHCNIFGKADLGTTWKYATGEIDLFAPEGYDNKYYKIYGKIRKNICYPEFFKNKYDYGKIKNLSTIYPRFFNQPYACCFIRNNIKEHQCLSITKNNLLNFTIELCIKNKVHLILFQDLIYTPLPNNEYIHEIQFNTYFDVEKYIYYSFNCDYFFGTTTSTHEIFQQYAGPYSHIISYIKHPAELHNKTSGYIIHVHAYDALVQNTINKDKKFIYLTNKDDITNVDNLLKQKMDIVYEPFKNNDKKYLNYKVF